MGLRLISLNIEMEKHLDLVTEFFRSHPADVICVQEIFEADVPLLEAAADSSCFFIPMEKYQSPRGPEVRGLGIFSRLPLMDTAIGLYAGNAGALTEFIEEETPEAKFNSQKYVLALATVEKDGVSYRIGTTHFPWTPDGEADDLQRRGLTAFLDVVGKCGELVFCGDFNAPRGKEIFSGIAACYRDNVPERYESSIDGTIHRVGPLPYMVDGLFSTPDYKVEDVEMMGGVSDHCALLATIEKNP